MKRVCVFCGSRRSVSERYRQAAAEFGRLLVHRGLGLVYGGGNIGLMGVVADAVLQAGGEVIGVIPDMLAEKELAHQGVTELLVVESMHARKAVMADRAAAFVALPGGFGTADELFEILTWRQLGIHSKPIGLLNVAGFFDPLLAWMDRMVADDFVKPQNRLHLEVESDGASLLAALKKGDATLF